MWYRSGCVALVSLLAAVPAAAQDTLAVAGSTPAECVQQANQWRTRQVTQLRAENKPVDAAALLKQAQRLAADCGRKFSIETATSPQLLELATLYNYAGDAELAKGAVERALKATDLTQRQHADVVLLAISTALAAHDAFAGASVEAETLVAQLDSVPDSLVDKKIRGHQLLLGRYSYGDYDAGIQKHAQALLELARRTGNKPLMINAYDELARAAADFLMPDSALRLMAHAERELEAPAGTLFQEARGRYSLVGKPAAPVAGEVWLNADPAPGSVAMADGKVRLVQFTAHWCAPCRNSYPGVLRLAERFKDRPFEVLFVTELYGNFEGKPATEEQELAADRAYYARHDIPFRIAINRYRKPAEGKPGQRPPLINQQYAVSGIPQILVVDQRGIIRQIVIGWDQGNEARLGAYIEKLLAGTGN